MAVEQVATELESVSLTAVDPEAACEQRWDLPLEDVYQLAVSFIKGCPGGGSGAGAQLSYENRMQLAALSQQILYGPCRSAQRPALGALDLIGKSRRQAWLALDYRSREECMLQYVELVHEASQHFEPYLLAHRQSRETELLQTEQLQGEEERRRVEQLAGEQLLDERQRQNSTRNQIKDALNRQTYEQFRAYAEHQYPGSGDQQAVLIRQLQDQHYQQYMQQLYQQHVAEQTAAVVADSSPADVVDGAAAAGGTAAAASGVAVAAGGTAAAAGGAAPADEEPPATATTAESPQEQPALSMEAARMWTRKDLVDFKTAIKKEGSDAILKVGHGETVTVRVPTHEEGSCLFWEFATDSYDLGFGVFFEWGATDEQQVTVHISDSGDEDDDSDSEEGSDPERGALPDEETPSTTLPGQPPTTCVIPVYRRDCHGEVYAGSHPYPGEGVYLLKFDNSYSLWRSKTLYYRVYYSH